MVSVMQKLIVASTLAGIFAAVTSLAQDVKRPRLIGISQIVLRAHDLDAARHFYGDLLGFQEAITVLKDQTAVSGGGRSQDQAAAVFFKVNNRQYIVVMPESATADPRFVRYAVETDDAAAMRLWLGSLGYAVPSKVSRTPAGDLAFQVSDPDGNLIEIMQYTPNSLSVQDFGKYLAGDRLSNRIIHAGFQISRPESVKFYLDGFAVREFWRSDASMRAPGAAAGGNTQTPVPLLATLSNLKLSGSDDYIEWGISRTRAPGSVIGGGHIALETPDMARTLAALEARPAFRDYKGKHEAHVGVNHKWQGNFFDPDGTRTEFMEHDTADGLPSPISRAPYFQ